MISRRSFSTAAGALFCIVMFGTGAARAAETVEPVAFIEDIGREAISSLTERERKVLELRFGLADGYSRTLEEVGKQFKVTRERIRQIEAKALRKMRHPTRIRQLSGFLEREEFLATS